MKIELRDLEYFAVVAEAGNVGRAAEKLNLSQPALSLGLRRLERATHSKIVARTPKGIELTAAGAMLLARIDRLRLAQEDVLREVSELGKGVAGHLRVGVSPGMHEDLLARAGSKLLVDAPRLTMTVEVETTAPLLTALRKGQLDMIVVTAIPDAGEGVVQEQIYLDKHVIYAALGHRLVRRKRVKPGDLVNERWASPPGQGGMQRILRQTLASLGLAPPNIVLTSRSLILRLRMIGRTDLLGFSSLSTVRQGARQYGLAEVKVEGLDLQRHSILLYREGGYLSPAAGRLVELLRSAAAEGI